MVVALDGVGDRRRAAPRERPGEATTDGRERRPAARATTCSIGGSDANVLAGRGGADRLDGGDGADRLDGGSGRDIADYQRRTLAVAVTLDGIADDGASR